MTPQEKRDQLQALREKIGQIMVGGKRPPGFTKPQRQAVFAKYEGRCAGCDDELQRGWHIDHIKEWADGGAHTLANWRALCPSCHVAKSRASQTDRAKPNRLREIEANGRKPSDRPIRSRNEWPKGQKIPSRCFSPTRGRP